jgi:hypothetical protein
MNQTTQMHQIAKELPDYSHSFTPYYCDGIVEVMRRWGLLDHTIAAGSFFRHTVRYLQSNNLHIDYRGVEKEYDLIVNCSDLFLPKNIIGKRSVLVQEGMTDPENFAYHLIKALPFLPRWIASTAAFGLSDSYDKFCVGSNGYRDLFISKGVKAEKIAITGIPNFDNCRKYLSNNFPYSHYVLVCTSDARETMKYEDRKKTIRHALEIAAGRQLIFKLHPNENHPRAISEIKRYAPEALIYTSGSAEEMIANCDVLITRFSSTIYVGLALGKEVHSKFDLAELQKLTPLQNNSAASNIADVCREMLHDVTLPVSKWPLDTFKRRDQLYT